MATPQLNVEPLETHQGPQVTIRLGEPESAEPAKTAEPEQLEFFTEWQLGADVKHHA